MKPLSASEKKRILSRLFWDVKSEVSDLDRLIDEKLDTIDETTSQQFFARLLTSCDWYTLIKLIPPDRLEKILSDSILDILFPKDLKEKFVYVKSVLSR